jgi:hypothetical protein
MFYKIEFPDGGAIYFCSRECARMREGLAVPVDVTEIPAGQYCRAGDDCCDRGDRPVTGHSEYYQWVNGTSGRKLT